MKAHKEINEIIMDLVEKLRTGGYVWRDLVEEAQAYGYSYEAARRIASAAFDRIAEGYEIYN